MPMVLTMCKMSHLNTVSVRQKNNCNPVFFLPFTAGYMKSTEFGLTCEPNSEMNWKLHFYSTKIDSSVICSCGRTVSVASIASEAAKLN